MSEPHVVRLALSALAVLVLAILAILGSDDIWVVVLTLVAIGLVAAVIVIDVWRLMDRSSREPADEERRQARSSTCTDELRPARPGSRSRRLAAAAGARQPEQLQIQQVQSLEDGAGAMLRAAARGCGQTLVGRSGFDPDAHPRLGTRSFDPPLLHDIVLMWTAESERDVIHDLGASFA